MLEMQNEIDGRLRLQLCVRFIEPRVPSIPLQIVWEKSTQQPRVLSIQSSENKEDRPVNSGDI